MNLYSPAGPFGLQSNVRAYYMCVISNLYGKWDFVLTCKTEKNQAFNNCFGSKTFLVLSKKVLTPKSAECLVHSRLVRQRNY